MHAFAALAVPENNVAIHWFGQNSFAIKDSAGTLFLVDPYFPRERPAEVFIHPTPPLDEAELEPHFVLLTHDHGDHTHPETLLRIHAAFPQTLYYGPVESMARLQNLGIPASQLCALRAGDIQQAASVTLHAMYSKPPQGVPAEGIPAPDVTHLGYGIEAGRARLYISGDLIYSFARHAELMNPVLQFKPGVGLLTTHPTEGEFPDFAGSVEMAVKLGLKTAIPAHYDCFVQRTFDPALWAAGFAPQGPQPVLIGYNQFVLYKG